MSRNPRRRMTAPEVEGKWKERMGMAPAPSERKALERFQGYPDPQETLVLAAQELQLLEYEGHRGLLEAMVKVCTMAMGYERWTVLRGELEALETELPRLLRLKIPSPQDPEGRPWANTLIRAVQAAQRETGQERPGRKEVLDRLHQEAKDVSRVMLGRWVAQYAREGRLQLGDDRVDLSPLEDAMWPFLKPLGPAERTRQMQWLRRLQEGLGIGKGLEITSVSGAD